MTRTNRRFIPRALVWLLLIVIIAAVALYMAPPRTHVVTAELRVRDPQPLLQTAPGGRVADETRDDLDRYAETCVELVRSRSVLYQALRDDKVKDLRIVKSHADFEHYLTRELQVTRPSPSLIEISLLCYENEGEDCQSVVNAVAAAFLKVSERNGVQSMSDRHRWLNKIHRETIDKLKRESEQLESLENTLGTTRSNLPPAVIMNPHLVRRTEATIDALADEIARLQVKLIVDEDFERQARLATLERLEAAYESQTKRLTNELTARVLQSTPMTFVTIEMKQHDIDRLKQHLDEISDAIRRTEWELEARGRIELISPASVTTRW